MKPNVETNHSTKGLLRLTMACNEKCSFCNVPMEDYSTLTPSKEAIFKQLDEFIDSGEQTLTISGGEPTLLRHRLLEVVRTARQRGVPFVELQSNAILIDEKYALELATVGVTSAFISLLSERADLHDELAGYPGAFERCILGIQALLRVGIHVTLNPVIARKTQERLVAYVRFVGTNLKGIRFISLSAVQPHGRARENLDLLPDYQQLAQVVPQAIAVAKEYGIEVLNPYCGLPVCIGWNKQLEHCVEVLEASQKDHRETFNISNHGDKSKGAACQWCVYRTQCGGAWHAYWTHRNGSGIHPPVEMMPPWIEVRNDQHQQVRLVDSIDSWGAEQIRTPTFWLIVRHIRRKDIGKILRVNNTELVWLCPPIELSKEKEKTKEIFRCARRIHQIYSLTQKRLHLFVDQDKCSSETVHMWTVFGDRIGCNVKIGSWHLEQSGET